MLKIQLAIFCLIASLVFTHDFTKEEGVLVLTDDNFDHALEHHPTMLVEFYAPWCGHCKSLAPEYAKAAQALQNQDLQVVLAKVDTTIHKKLGERYEIKGFPTLKFFKDGNVMEYNGGRTEQTIINWLKKKVGTQSTSVSSKQEIDDLASKGVVAAYFGEDSEQFQSFLKAADKFEDVTFVHSSNTDLQKELSAATITLFKNFDEKINLYQGDYSVDSIFKFIDANSIPTILGFDQKAAEIIFQNQRTTIFNLLGTNSADNEESQKSFEEASKFLKGKIVMSQTQVAEGFGQRLGEYVGIKPENGPVCLILEFQGENMLKFKMEGKQTAQSIVDFYESFLSGKLSPLMKSQEIPETQEENVYTLVGKSFQSIVMDESKDVLVEFYAPWCGHCKTLAPKFEELATKLKNNKNILIAKMDSTENEVSSVAIKGFPTLKLFKRGSKSTPIDYSGAREVQDMIDFLKSNTNWEEAQEDSVKNEDL